MSTSDADAPALCPLSALEARDDDPGAQVERATPCFLELAASWIAWDGVPRMAEGGGRVMTPHKAVRRYADHLVDHLAQVEALLAGVPTQPNGWHESRVTTPADLAPFTEADLVEAAERITRLSRTLRLRLLAAGPDAWDVDHAPDWTLRQIAEHVGDPWYAEQLGDLSR